MNRLIRLGVRRQMLSLGRLRWMSSQVHPSLMPQEVDEWGRLTVEKYVNLCGVEAVWPVFKKDMDARRADIHARTCITMLRHCKPHMAEPLMNAIKRLGLEKGYVFIIYMERMALDLRPETIGKLEDTLTEMKFRAVNKFNTLIMYAHDIIIEHLMKMGDEEQSKVWMQKMRDINDGNLGGRTYLCLIRAAAEKGDHKAVDETYTELVQSRTELDMWALMEIMIRNSLERNDLDKAEKLAARCRHASPQKSLSLEMVKTFIQYHLEVGSLTSAMAVFHRAMLSGPEPDEELYFMLMEPIEKSGNIPLSREMDRLYRWNILKEGVAKAKRNQEMEKRRLIKDLKYTGPMSLKKHLRFRDVKMLDEDMQERNEDAESTPSSEKQDAS